MGKKLLYREIMDYIENRIHKCELKQNDILQSEFELSKEFGVSRITARKALEELEHKGLIYRIKGKGSFVCDRSAVQSITEVNGSKFNVVALVLPFGSSLGRGMDMIQGMSAALNKSGYYLTIHTSHFSSDEEREIINDLVNDGVSGIILYPFSHRKNIDLINRLILDEYPIITIDKYFDALPVSCVLSDNFNGSYIAASHLIKLGHREIVFASDYELESTTSVRDRYLGFCKALKDNSIELKNDNLITIKTLDNEAILNALQSNNSSNDSLLDPIRRIVDMVLNNKKGYTAIHTLHDYFAIYLLKVALEMGVKVPDELSIVGFDNIENSSYVEVPLTTVQQNFYKIGEEAGKLIQERISNPSVESKRIVIPVELIKRNSTMPVKFLEKTGSTSK